MWRRVLIAGGACMALAACGRTSAMPSADSTPTPSPSPNPETDWQTFQSVLDGDLAAADGLLAVAQSGGWPIETDEGFVFARLDDGNGPYALAGDHNGWETEPMTAEGGVWWVRSEVAEPAGSLYKFVGGAQDYGPDPMARSYGFDEYGEFSLVRPGSGPRLDRWPMLTDGVVSPRTVRVWVPSTIERHLYVHDGQNLFHPDAPYGGWHLQDSLGPGTMAIGIDSNQDRTWDYTHVADIIDGQTLGGGGDDYADFVQLWLRPFIEQRYGEPDTVGVMGSSFGGIISFHIAQRHAGAFDFAASLSGSFWWGGYQAGNETLIERYADDPPLGTALFLDSGGGPGSGCIDSDGDGIEDDTPDSADNYCETRQLADILPTVGYEWDTDLWHWWEPDAPHNEAAWAARVWRPVQLFEDL